MIKLLVSGSILFFILFSTYLPGVEIVLERGEEHYRVAVADFESNTDTGNRIRNVIISNLSAYRQFKVVSSNLSSKSKPLYEGRRIQPNYRDWEDIDAQFVVYARIQEENERVDAEFGLFDIRARGLIFNKKMTTPQSNWRGLAHRISTEVFYTLTGEKPSFSTRVAFVSDAPGETEIYLMDWDGHNSRRITRQNALIVAPAWAQENNYLFYTSYRHVNPDLYRLNMRTGEIKIISDTPLQNLGAHYSSVHNRILVALGKGGDPELYSMDIDGNNPKRLTYSPGAIESDPNWSPCGNYVVFASDRTGPLRAYVMNYNSGETRRLTGEAVMQSEPYWSVNNVIVFTTRVNRMFQVATVNADGSNFQVLTEGNYDSYQPTWSPCGEFIYFVSNKEGNRRIYRMNADGSNKKMLTVTDADCKNPAVSDFYY